MLCWYGFCTDLGKKEREAGLTAIYKSSSRWADPVPADKKSSMRLIRYSQQTDILQSWMSRANRQMFTIHRD
jgi:hypothetical protein